MKVIGAKSKMIEDLYRDDLIRREGDEPCAAGAIPVYVPSHRSRSRRSVRSKADYDLADSTRVPEILAARLAKSERITADIPQSRPAMFDLITIPTPSQSDFYGFPAPDHLNGLMARNVAARPKTARVKITVPEDVPAKIAATSGRPGLRAYCCLDQLS